MVKGRGEVLAMEKERKKEREGLQVYNTQNQAVRFSLVSTNERANMAARTNGSGTGSSHAKNIRCHHCAGPLSKEMETGKWTVPPLIRDSFSMIGSAVGGTASAFYGFNLVMPVVQRRVKGPMWLHFLVCAPPVIVFSSACAGLAGGATPALAQLASTSYHAIMSSPPSEDEKIQKSRTSSTL